VLVQADAPLPLNVRSSAALRFLAASGTADRSRSCRLRVAKPCCAANRRRNPACPASGNPVTMPPMRSM